MNATRSLARKGASVVKYTYERSKASFQSNMIQGVAIVALILYSAILLRYLPLKFLTFFEHISVKIVVLVIIAFVGLYSPAVALFIAIALISTLQMAQKKKLIGEIGGAKMRENIEDNLQSFSDDMMDDILPSPSFAPSLSPSPSPSDYYINNDYSSSSSSAPSMAVESLAMGNVVESMSNNNSPMDFGQQYLDPEVMQKQRQEPVMEAPKIKQAPSAPSDEYLPAKEAPRESKGSPQGYNENAPCLPCGGGQNNNALNSQCGYVQTWENQFSAQGLGMDITGYQNSVGYPV